MKTCPKCGKANEMPFHTCKPLPTDTELNLAMCEWMGLNPFRWRFVQVHENGSDWNYCSTEQEALSEWDAELDGPIERVYSGPNYLSDDSPRRLLNEAEAKLTTAQRMEFYRYLLASCDRDASSGFDVKNAIHATARQRVIAILQTVKPEVFQ